MKNFYITTPIYYVNDVPHIGNAYTTIMADTFTRFEKLVGRDPYFLTGTDENATKVAAVAKQKGIPTQEFVDQLSSAFQGVWKNLDVQYNDFIRTTQPRHIDVVTSIFKQLYDQGDIYKGEYEGWYCMSCETFFLESEMGEDHCCPNPECRKKCELIKEENYYFALSKYSDKLLKYIKEHPDFLMPEFRKNEVVGFIKQGLRDISISRKNDGWGIPVPGDESKVIYVWFDALINYISAAGYLSDPEKFTKLWPADLQLMGKDIFVRFHCTFWPAILMALGLEMPKHLIGHGFWTIDGEKISKSKGNAINPAKVAKDLSEESGAKLEVCKDVVRYYLCRETSFGQDADFSFANFRGRYNSDLSNDLGNILNRTLGMLNSYNEGNVPDAEGGELNGEIKATCDAVLEAMDKFQPNLALDAIWNLISAGNKYINDMAPWVLKKEEKFDELYKVLVTALEVVRSVAILVEPFMPNVAKEIARQLNIDINCTWEEIIKPGCFKGVKTNSPEPIFPRMDLKKINEKKDKKVEEVKEVKVETAPEKKEEEYISIDDFCKVDLRVAEIIKAERIEGADKLLKLTMDVGDHQRTICAGMAPYYDPEYMVGKQVVIVANLKPRKMRGIMSEGMMLAGGEEEVKFLSPEAKLPNGAKIR